MTEMIIIIIGVIIIVLYLLLKLGILKRKVIVTIVENLPIGIFRDKNKTYEPENKVYIKEINLNKNDITSGKSEDTEVVEDNESLEGGVSDVKIDTVYWTPKGKTYHKSISCFALSRSKVINEGTIEESKKDTHCDLCKES